MGHRIIYLEDREPARTQRAGELAPSDLDIGIVDPSLPRESLTRELADCMVLINPHRAFKTEHLDLMPNVRLLQLMSAGFDRLDIPAIHERGVRVANSSAAIANSVAEHAVMLMLMVYRRASQCIEGPRDGTWQEKAKSGAHGNLYELTGRTVGVVGLGNIGSRVAGMLRGFNTETLYTDTREFSPARERELAVQRVGFEELLERSDVVTAHVPLSSRTRGMFGAREFEVMRNEAIFINTCRGGVHDEPALINALQTGKIMAAGLDVTVEEPTPLDNPLLRMDNVIVTPHAGGSSQERVDRAIVFGFENARRVLEGREPESLVEIQD